MRGGAQEQELGGADPQQGARGARLGLQRPFQAALDGIVDLAEPAQHGRDDQTGKGAIARLQPGQRGAGFENRVERLAAV
jgi:hypothetical protein